MMTGIFAIIVVFPTLYYSYKGIQSEAYLHRFAFDVERIRVHREYYRMFSSGFVHASWIHFGFNMVALFSFSSSLEWVLGFGKLAIIYAGSLIAGNLLALFVHRNDSGYRAVGASGAVSGLVFASIAFFPNASISLVFLPIHLPSWAFGLLYILYSIYGMRAKRDNIGHDAHFGGGIAGLLIAVLLFPNLVEENYLTLLLLLIPACIFFYFLITKSNFLIADNPFSSREGVTIEDRYNARKRKEEEQMDLLLDKINRKGIDSLSKNEKEFLNKLSKKR